MVSLTRLVGYTRLNSFYGNVKYVHIELGEDEVQFYPSRQGSIVADLPVFNALMSDSDSLANALNFAMDACEL